MSYVIVRNVQSICLQIRQVQRVGVWPYGKRKALGA